MNVDGKHFRTVWVDKDEQPMVKIIDQTKLPFAFEIENLKSVNALVSAIKNNIKKHPPVIVSTMGYWIDILFLHFGQIPLKSR